MKIDCRAIAREILLKLEGEVDRLKKHGVTPTLAVIQVGDSAASLSYIKQKQTTAESIGARVIVCHEPETISSHELGLRIRTYNENASIHGLIIQRPLPPDLLKIPSIVKNVLPRKDVDGFVENSRYPVPVARAIELILTWIYQKTMESSAPHLEQYQTWLTSLRMTVIGRGETGGLPIQMHLRGLGITPQIIHSQTPDSDELLRVSDVIISCVGKEHVVDRERVKPGAILISVGISKDRDGKLHGDYEEQEIENIAAFYTPTPGGVGPVNVACLIENLVTATRILTTPHEHSVY